MLDHQNDKPLKDQPFGPIRWAWSFANVPPTARLLLLKLIDHDHLDSKTKTRKAVVWPAQTRIAKELSVDTSTVALNLAKLEELGLIARTKNRRRYVAEYRINYDAVVIEGTVKRRKSSTVIYRGKHGQFAVPESRKLRQEPTKQPTNETQELASSLRRDTQEKDNSAPPAADATVSASGTENFDSIELRHVGGDVDGLPSDEPAAPNKDIDSRNLRQSPTRLTDAEFDARLPF